MYSTHPINFEQLLEFMLCRQCKSHALLKTELLADLGSLGKKITFTYSNQDLF